MNTQRLADLADTARRFKVGEFMELPEDFEWKPEKEIQPQQPLARRPGRGPQPMSAASPLPAQSSIVNRPESRRVEKLAAIRRGRTGPTRQDEPGARRAFSGANEPAQTALQLAVMPRQADNDAQLVELWLHGRPMSTRTTYVISYEGFRSFVQKPLQQVTLRDLQRFCDWLAYLAPSSQATRIAPIKSLFGFAHKLGYLAFDVARAIKLPKLRDHLSERILSEEDVRRMISLEPVPRNRVLLRLLYVAGLRVSEAVALTWGDVQARGDSGQLTVFGKGGKTRAILLPREMYEELATLRNGASSQEAVFLSYKTKGHLTKHRLWFLVKEAAARAGIEADVSPHWLRHAHASHALDHGAPPHLVQATLGHASLQTTSRYAHARPGESSSLYLEGAEPVEMVLPSLAPLPPLSVAPRIRGGDVRKARERLGLSLNQLALQLGIAWQTLHDLEEGHTVATDSVARTVGAWLADTPGAEPSRPKIDGAAIREARIARGVTAAALAGVLGISRPAVTMIENDKLTPGLRTATLLQRWLDDAR